MDIFFLNVGGVEMNNIDELLSRWDEHRTFSDLPFREDMRFVTVTLDEPKTKLDKLIDKAKQKVNNSIKKIRSSINIER
jgi:hypothetical protein